MKTLTKEPGGLLKEKIIMQQLKKKNLHVKVMKMKEISMVCRVGSV